MDVNETFRDRAERQIFAVAMEFRIRQFPYESPDDVAKQAWAMVLKYRSRCPANDAGMTFETLAGEAISAGLGRPAEDWETMPAVEPDAGPTESDLRGEVQHGV